MSVLKPFCRSHYRFYAFLILKPVLLGSSYSPPTTTNTIITTSIRVLVTMITESLGQPSSTCTALVSRA